MSTPPTDDEALRNRLDFFLEGVRELVRAQLRPSSGARCDRCHHEAPNPNGCARCAPEILGERLRAALAREARLEEVLENTLYYMDSQRLMAMVAPQLVAQWTTQTPNPEHGAIEAAALRIAEMQKQLEATASTWTKEKLDDDIRLAEEALAIANAAMAREDAAEGVVFRAGRTVGRTLYRNNVIVGTLDTPELAAEVAEALNARRKP